MRGELIIWLLATMGVFLAAAAASRSYVGNDSWLLLATALVLYTLGNLMMLKLMRESGMGIAISVSAVGQLVLVNLVAIGWFGERPSPQQTAGILLGLASVALIVWPRGQV